MVNTIIKQTAVEACRSRTVGSHVVPENSRSFRLENLDEHHVELNAFQKHPGERRHEEIVQNYRHNGAQDLQRTATGKSSWEAEVRWRSG